MANITLDHPSQLTILSIATEWDSGHGGLSTFNRELCKALASLGHNVYCGVPSHSSEEVADALRAGVRLVTPAPTPGVDDDNILLRRVRLPSPKVDVIIGHGRIAGRFAVVQKSDYFPDAKYVHFVHMDPKAIEWYKDHRERDATTTAHHRRNLEISLGREATLIVAVGPELHEKYSQYFHGISPHLKVHEFLPGLFPSDWAASPPLGYNCLLFGRVDDKQLKGVDLAAEAMGLACKKSNWLHCRLRVMGASGDSGDDLQKTLQFVAGTCEVVVEPYSSSKSEVLEAIRSASVVLMPSRVEGFGLSGLEAISEGIPVLVSNKSGLARAIVNAVPHLARYHVVDINRGAEELADRVMALLNDQATAFDCAKALRTELTPHFSWTRASLQLIEALISASSPSAPSSGECRMRDVAESNDALESMRSVLLRASSGLLAWRQTLRANGRWLERPELRQILDNIAEDTSKPVVILGLPGSGKSALLARVASQLVAQKSIVLAIKADRLSNSVESSEALSSELGLTDTVVRVIRAAAGLAPTTLIIDQLDALGDLVDLKTSRLSVLLSTVTELVSIEGLHVVMSCRSIDFHHDVRFQRLGAHTVELALPELAEVESALGSAGAAVSQLPTHVREMLRNPQCLDVFMELFTGGSAFSAFQSYQVMLDELWRLRLAQRPDARELEGVLGKLALLMGEREELWVALSEVARETSLQKIDSLIGLGFLLRSEGRVAFTHQTFYEFARARAFLQQEASLTAYTLTHQGSLFVRPTLWASLAYLRKMAPSTYAQNLESLWSEPSLRRHVKSLLIEFLGSVDDPSEKEIVLLVPTISDLEWSGVTIEAVTGSAGWFEHLRGAHLPVLLSSARAHEGVFLLARATEFAVSEVGALMARHWKDDADKHRLIAFVLNSASKWDEALGELAVLIASQGKVDRSMLGAVVSSAVTLCPNVAPRIVRAHLDRCLEEIPHPVENPDGASASPWGRASHRRELHRPYDDLLHDGGGLYSLAEAAVASPREFVEYVWPWFVKVVQLLLDAGSVPALYKQDDALGTSADAKEIGYEVAHAIEVALFELVAKDSATAVAFVEEWKNEDAMAVQRFLTNLLRAGVPALAPCALQYLIEDPRRLVVGDYQCAERDTARLIEQLAPMLTRSDVMLLEERIRISSCVEEDLPEISPESLAWRQEENNRHRLRLLQALGVERVSSEARTLIESGGPLHAAAEDGRFGTGLRVIGSPMSPKEMLAVSDDALLKFFEELPDSTGFDHPTRFMDGGSVQASEALGEATKSDPERFAALIQRFKKGLSERPVVRVIEALAETLPYGQIETIVLELSNRGFFAVQFRQEVAHILERAARAGVGMSDTMCDLLVSWLREEDAKVPVKPETSNVRRTESILFGMSGGGIVPSGNFPILMALGAAYLGAKVPNPDKWFAVIEQHLDRNENSAVWESMLRYFKYTFHSRPDRTSNVLDRLFARFPTVRDCRDGAAVIAHAMHYTSSARIERWMTDLWNGEWDRREQAFGELLVLAATKANSIEWARSRLESEVAAFENGSAASKDMIRGVAHALSHLWDVPERRDVCTDYLLRLIPKTDGELVQPVMHCLNFADGLLWDEPTKRLLAQVVHHPRVLVTINRARFVGNLRDVLPVGAELVCDVVEALVDGVSAADAGPGFFHDGPDLVDIAMTLQRLGDPLRERGLRVFEQLLRLNAYGAKDMLAEIDPVSRRRGVVHRPVRRRTPRARAKIAGNANA